ncbi:MAG: hypothetical protein WDW38_006209 [Sanguina aurantia]
MHTSDSFLHLLGFNTFDSVEQHEAQPSLPRSPSSRRLGSADSGSDRGKTFPCDASAYKLLHTAGTGASSTVYAATCLPLDERVAIKCCNLEESSSDCSEMVEEVLAMRKYKHPCILPLYCTFVKAAELWMVMEFCEGGSVAHILKFKYPDGLDEVAIATIIKPALKALEYIHKQGDMHRDVKSGNILLKGDGSVLLGDFGVSCSMQRAASWGSSQASRMTMVGTPCWMAPEVMEQENGYASPADIWSLGITLLELAHGHAPFYRSSPLKILMMTLQNPPPTLEDHIGSRVFSKNMREVVALCLQKDPQRRPTAAALLEHRFFRQARDKEWVAKHLLAGLPPLHEREQRIKKGKAASCGVENDAHLAASMSKYYENVQDWDFSLSHTALDSLDANANATATGTSTPTEGASPAGSLSPSPAPSSSHKLMTDPSQQSSVHGGSSSNDLPGTSPPANQSQLHTPHAVREGFGERLQAVYSTAAPVTSPLSRGGSLHQVQHAMPGMYKPGPQTSAAWAWQSSLEHAGTQAASAASSSSSSSSSSSVYMHTGMQRSMSLESAHQQQQQQHQQQEPHQQQAVKQRGRFLVVSEERVVSRPDAHPASSSRGSGSSGGGDSSLQCHPRHPPCLASQDPVLVTPPAALHPPCTSRHKATLTDATSSDSDSTRTSDVEGETSDASDTGSPPHARHGSEQGIRHPAANNPRYSSTPANASQSTRGQSFAFPSVCIGGDSPNFEGVLEHRTTTFLTQPRPSCTTVPESTPPFKSLDTRQHDSPAAASTVGESAMRTYTGWPRSGDDSLLSDDPHTDDSCTPLPSEVTISGWNGTTRRGLVASLQAAVAANSASKVAGVSEDTTPSCLPAPERGVVSLTGPDAAAQKGLRVDGTGGISRVSEDATQPALPLSERVSISSNGIPGPAARDVYSNENEVRSASVRRDAACGATAAAGGGALQAEQPATLPPPLTRQITKGRFKIVSITGG